MTEKEFNTKWGSINLNSLSDEEFLEFKNDCYELYEKTGFIEKFDSPYDDQEEHKGMTFKVIRRATTDEVDIEVMPVWFVEFENGDTVYCYPEEICKAWHDSLARDLLISIV